MSVQSEINRISNEVNEQAEIIEQIKTALEGKAAGGASAETCLVQISDDSFGSVSFDVYYTTVEDGTVTSRFLASNSFFDREVLKGSIMVVRITENGNDLIELEIMDEYGSYDDSVLDAFHQDDTLMIFKINTTCIISIGGFGGGA